MADCERALWSRTHIVKEIYLDTISREDSCYILGKEAAVVAAVMTYYNRDLLLVLEVQFKIVGKSLCCHANCIDIHTIATCTHDTTKTTGTKFKVLVETFDEIGLVFRSDERFYLLTSSLVKSRS